MKKLGKQQRSGGRLKVSTTAPQTSGKRELVPGEKCSKMAASRPQGADPRVTGREMSSADATGTGAEGGRPLGDQQATSSRYSVPDCPAGGNVNSAHLVQPAIQSPLPKQEDPQLTKERLSTSASLSSGNGQDSFTTMAETSLLTPWCEGTSEKSCCLDHLSEQSPRSEGLVQEHDFQRFAFIPNRPVQTHESKPTQHPPTPDVKVKTWADVTARGQPATISPHNRAITPDSPDPISGATQKNLSDPSAAPDGWGSPADRLEWESLSPPLNPQHYDSPGGRRSGVSVLSPPPDPICFSELSTQSPSTKVTIHPSESYREGPVDLDLRHLIQQLPTKQDFEACLQRLEASFQRGLSEVREKIVVTDTRVVSLESSHDDLNTRLSRLESAHALHQSKIATLQLQVDDLEDRHRRNNIRIRGVPEATTPGSVKPVVLAILNNLLEKDPASPIELDRVHRTLGPPRTEMSRPRDIICRVHFFSIKEEILRRAWLRGPLDWDGAEVQVFPDLSGRTLLRRRLLKPLLEKVREAGATYRWGFPFHLIIRRNNNTFVLRSHADLPELFVFLDATPINVADWMFLDEEPPQPPLRLRRNRRRSRTSRQPRSNLGPEAAEP